MTSEKKRVSYFYHPDIGNYYYGHAHPMKPHRIRMAHNLITNLGLYKYMEIYRPTPAAMKELTRFHSDEYIDFLARVSTDNMDQFIKQQAKFNVGEDCPIFDGLYEFSSIAAGGSISGANKISRGESDIVINWGGGLHHAKRNEASGFCYVNDIVLGALELLRYAPRVLYVDIDVHHGDGVEEAFYTSDRVMTVSFHKYGEFFPGTGDINDVGHGPGKHYAVNVPLRDGIDDESYQYIFKTVMSHVMEWYRPDAIILQSGADSLSGDRLGCFNLSMRGHAFPLQFLKKYNVPILLVGGGGYTVRNVARAWTYETAVALERHEELPDALPYNEYFNYYGPEYRLDVVPSNMENHNTKEYLDKLRVRIIENLRNVAFAPSVQVQEVPRDMDSDDDAEEDLESAKDKRLTERQRDKLLAKDEFSDSDDEFSAEFLATRRLNSRLPKGEMAATQSLDKSTKVEAMSESELQSKCGSIAALTTEADEVVGETDATAVTDAYIASERPVEEPEGHGITNGDKMELSVTSTPADVEMD